MAHNVDRLAAVHDAWNSLISAKNRSARPGLTSRAALEGVGPAVDSLAASLAALGYPNATRSPTVLGGVLAGLRGAVSGQGDQRRAFARWLRSGAAVWHVEAVEAGAPRLPPRRRRAEGPPLDVLPILDTWDTLTARLEAGAPKRKRSPRSLAARDVFAHAAARAALEPLLAAAGWPDATATAGQLGAALQRVARMASPAPDGRWLRRTGSARWYVVQGEAV